MAGHRKAPRTEARDAHSPAKRHGEAGKTYAVRFRQIAVQPRRIWLIFPGKHHSDRLVGRLTPFRLPQICGGSWTLFGLIRT